MATSLADYLTKDIFVRIYNIANSTGTRVFVVGEFLRDYYLNRKSNRIEIVVEGDAIAFGRMMGMHTHTYVSYFKNYGISKISYKGDEIVFASAKKRISNPDSGQPTFVSGSIKDDLRRRDFTINALALSLNSSDFGEQIDLFGGLEDISQGIIRTPFEPNSAFRYKPLLMLKAIRLASELSTPERKFHISSDCLDAIWESADKVDSIAKERVSEELNKILLSDVPSTGIKLLEDLRILRRIIPALSATKGVDKVDGIGHADSFPHSLMVVDNIAKLEVEQSSEATNSLGIKQGEPNLWLRWAALLHEIGKPATKRYVRGKGWTFNGYEVVGAKMISSVFSSLKMPQNDNMRYVQKLLSLQLRPKTLLEDKTSESAYRRLLIDAGDDIMDLMLLCKANVTTVNKAKANKEFVDLERVTQQLLEVKSKEAVRNFKNPISANYIMELYGLEPCNTLGVLKEFIKRAILDGEIGNNFEEADVLLRKKAAEIGLKVKEERYPDKGIAGDIQPIEDTISSETPSEETLIDHADKGSFDEEIEPTEDKAVQESLHVDSPRGPEIPVVESHVPISPEPKTDYSEIIRFYNSNGITKLYFHTTEEEFNAIQDGHYLVKERFHFFTHDFSKEVRKESLIALEVDLRVLSLPGTVITFEDLLSRGITYCTEVSNIKRLDLDEGVLCLLPKVKELQSFLAGCVVITRDRLPFDYIINFDSMKDEDSSSLPF